jgi:hypothetical protein
MRSERRSGRRPGAIPSRFRILSGGQTGADRAALNWAIARGIPHGGWCPKGRRAEDGTIGRRYRLQETPSAAYAQRTEWNVRDADGTVILSLRGKLTGGARLTAQLARRRRQPLLHLSREGDGRRAGEKLRAFVRAARIRVLNVAGPRASEEPAVGRFVRATLEAAFASRPLRRRLVGQRSAARKRLVSGRRQLSLHHDRTGQI